VVVGLDGSEASGKAACWAATYAHAVQAEVVAVHAVPLLTALLRDIPPGGLSPWRRELRREFVEEWCAPFRDAGIRFRAIITDEAAGRALQKVADQFDAELLVVGAGRHEFHRSPGVVCGTLARHTRRPVVLVGSTPPGPLSPPHPARAESS
jgi:nucleotide-binding universal stress UspA family protein